MTATIAENVEILRPLVANEVEELLELYRNKYGINNFHYILMYNQRKWDQQLQALSAEDDQYEENDWISFRKRFYTHRDCDFRKYGTYVSLHTDMMQSVSFHSWQPDFKELFECLTQTSLINWKDGPLLTNVDLPYAEEVKRIALAKGSSVQRARLCHGLVLPHEKALNLPMAKLPSDYRLSRLEARHAQEIHSMWNNKKEGSEQYVKGLIQLNKTLGIFRASDDALVAWIFQNDFSGLGILQVLQSEQRKGFGRLLAACLSKQIAETELVQLTVWIVVENFKSEALLEQVGFRKSVMNEWIQLNKASVDTLT